MQDDAQLAVLQGTLIWWHVSDYPGASMSQGRSVSRPGWGKTCSLFHEILSVSISVHSVFWSQDELELRGQSVLLRGKQLMNVDVLTRYWLFTVRLWIKYVHATCVCRPMAGFTASWNPSTAPTIWAGSSKLTRVSSCLLVILMPYSVLHQHHH